MNAMHASVALTFIFCPLSFAQDASTALFTGPAPEEVIRIQVTPADYAAAGARRHIHTTGARRPEGGQHPAKTFETDSSGALVEVTGISPSSIQSMAVAASQAATDAPPFTGPGFYPADLSLLTTAGQVVTSAQIHYVHVAAPQALKAADASHHQITTFDPPGAGTAAGQGTFPQQNLNSGAIVGYYVDAKNVAHGFIRSADGNYTPIDVPYMEAAGTQAYGINHEGTALGWWFEANGVYHGYLRDDHGDFTTFDVPGAAPLQSQAGSPLVVIPLPLAINRGGTVTGSYVDQYNVFHCFVRSRDGRIETFDASSAGTGSGQGTIGDTNGINRAGAISGGYFTADGVAHGFVRDPEGTITSFDGPGAGTTKGNGSVAQMINDAGTIPGVSLDNNSLNHAFIRYSDGTFVTFDVTGAGTASGQGTLATTTNVAGITAGNYFDANGVGYGFVRFRDGRITTFDVTGQGTSLGQGVTAINSINDEGAAVGWYVDANGAYHGFIYQSEDD